MIQLDTGEGMDLSGLFSATQIHTDDAGVHTDEDGHVYDAVTVDGELTFVPQEEYEPVDGADLEPGDQIRVTRTFVDCTEVETTSNSHVHCSNNWNYKVDVEGVTFERQVPQRGKQEPPTT